jgi:Histidine kinase/Histidine kinase-, DNA gyrase B-, and HSP90-like ATPase
MVQLGAAADRGVRPAGMRADRRVVGRREPLAGGWRCASPADLAARAGAAGIRRLGRSFRPLAPPADRFRPTLGNQAAPALESTAMFPSIEPGNRFVPSPWKKVRDIYALVVLFSALAAAVVTLASPSFRGFLRWLFIAESIGMTAVTIGTFLGRLPRLRRLTPRVAHLFIGGLAIPLGYVIGSSFAYAMLGEPLPILQPEPRRIVALLATGLAALFIVYLDAMRQRIENEAAARIAAQRRAVESQLRLLRAQLEPHMLFNTLANLRSLVEADPKLAQTMIDQVILYLRAALAASREEAVTLRQEFAQLRAYLEIMSLRMGARLSCEFELPEGLQDFSIPPMLLQPLVENAIKHGVEPKIGKSSIRVAARRNGGAVEISVTDTGLGFEGRGPGRRLQRDAPGLLDVALDGASSGYGLTHVRERLEACYGTLATLSLEANAPQGVRATVRIAS